MALYAGVIYTRPCVTAGVLDARLLLYPLAASYLVTLFWSFLNLTGLYGWHWLALHRKWFNSLVTKPFNISVENLAEFLLQGALLGMLVLRFARARRDQERLENELAAARAAQQVLIPTKTVQPTGFSVQSA